MKLADLNLDLLKFSEVLLKKTFQYYHQLKCKPSVPLRDTVQPETKTNEITKYENTTVDFDNRRSTPQRPV